VELDVVTVDVLVVVAPTQVQSIAQVSPGWQLKEPPAEPGSHSSPASTTPLPHSVLVVVLVLELEVVTVVVVEVVGPTQMQSIEQVSPG
jgi:hypothetical protein